MKLFKRWIASTAIATTFTLAVAPASALTVDGLTTTFTCDQVDLSPHTLTFDRDTGGNNGEGYLLSVTDGEGTVLASQEVPLPGIPVGAVVNENAQTLVYSPPAASNPITLTYVSPAGNGFPEQVAYSDSFVCPALEADTRAVPALPLGGLALLSLLLLGVAKRRFG